MCVTSYNNICIKPWSSNFKFRYPYHYHIPDLCRVLRVNLKRKHQKDEKENTYIAIGGKCRESDIGDE